MFPLRIDFCGKALDCIPTTLYKIVQDNQSDGSKPSKDIRIKLMYCLDRLGLYVTNNLLDSTQHNTIQRSTIQHNTAQYNTKQNNTSQHSTASFV